MSGETLPALVTRLRERLNLTQEQFAHHIGVTYSTVNHWENGKRVPQPFLMQRLLGLRDALEAGPAAPGKPEAPGPALGPASGGGKGSAGRQEGDIPVEVQEMVERIVRDFRPEKVILFGSYARGDARPDSDVDLLVVMPVEGSKRKAQLSVRRALRDVSLPKDVIVSTPEEFEWRQHVAGTIERPASREGRVLYARG